MLTRTERPRLAAMNTPARSAEDSATILSNVPGPERPEALAPMHLCPPRTEQGDKACTATPAENQPHIGAMQLRDRSPAQEDPPGQRAWQPSDMGEPATASSAAAPLPAKSTLP